MKIAIIGTGNVGSTAAYTIITQGIADEVLLIDYNKEKAIAEAADILHATSVNEHNFIYAGDYKDLKDFEIIVITAGAGRKPGQSRIDLLKNNVGIIKSIAENIKKYAPNSIIIVASNPVDIMAHVVLDVTRFPKNRVISTGTTLDTSRFKSEIAKHLRIPTKIIDAYVLGEHGDSQVPIWDNAQIANIDIKEYAKINNNEFTQEKIEEINSNTIKGGQIIIQGKGATFYGVGACIARICKAIANNENTILTVASLQENIEGIKNVFISMPTIINSNGIKEVIFPKLSNDERELLKKSALAVEANTKIAIAEI